MIWRTDKPKGSPIVVYRNGNPRPEVLFLATKPYPHYYDDGGEEIPDGMIQKWASLEEKSKKPVPIGLEEAAEEYEKKHTYQRYDGGGLTPEYDATLAEAFIAGHNLCWEQMMKDAVEGYVERDCGGQLILGRENSPAGDEFMLLDSSLFPEIHAREKYRVHIIIIKEDSHE